MAVASLARGGGWGGLFFDRVPYIIFVFVNFESSLQDLKLELYIMFIYSMEYIIYNK